MNTDFIEIGRHTPLLMGLAFVLFTAAGRFNTPSTNRSSTTAFRYHMAQLAYLLIAALSYFLLVNAFPLMKQLISLPGEAGGSDGLDFLATLDPALAVALALSTLIDRIPIINQLDAKLIKTMHYVAAIPFEVRQLMTKLATQAETLPVAWAADVLPDLPLQALEQFDKVPEGPQLRQQWQHCSMLLQTLKNWEQQRRFAGFFYEFADAYRNATQQAQQFFEELDGRLDTIQLLNRKSARGKDNQEALKYQLRLLQNDSKQLHDTLLELLCRGVLQCYLRNSERSLALGQLGFRLDNRDMDCRSTFTLNQAVTIAWVVLLLTFLFSTLMGIVFPAQGVTRGERQLLRQILLPTMIALNYVASTFFALYPKSRFSNASRDENGQRPASTYLLSGLMAVATCFSISLLFLGLRTHFNPSCMELGWPRSLTWQLMPLSNAIGLAYLCDNHYSASWSKRQIRWFECGAHSLVMVCCFFVVNVWLGQLQAPEPALAQLCQNMPRSDSSMRMMFGLTSTALIGAYLGYSIPTFYRDAMQRRRDGQAPLPASSTSISLRGRHA